VVLWIPSAFAGERKRSTIRRVIVTLDRFPTRG
jgi:hypothetical protein